MTTHSNGANGLENEDGDDLIAYFLQDMEYHGRSERTRQWYARVLRQFEQFTSSNGKQVDSLEEVGSRQCLMWLHTLREKHSSGTIATYASCINRFYSYMMSIDKMSSNPMSIVMEEMDESIETDPDRRDISIEQMRSFLTDILHPLDRALILMLLKTGMRVGELTNLDLNDLNLDTDHLENSDLPTCKPQIAGKKDSVYISNEISRGDTINGEQRTASNKRRRSTIVPIDNELRTTLECWLAIRPDPIAEAQPLFLNISDDWGHRITPSIVRSRVKKHATEMNWYDEGGDATQNVTPHYFRHFFTTHLRDRTGDRGIVKYLRGDVADDVLDTYTHNWGDRVRETYEANIYRLL